MTVVDRAALRRLAEWSEGPCVSIFMSTHRSGIEARQQDTIRLRNLLGDAEAKLADAGVKPQQITSLLAPAQRLFEEGAFWAELSDGLALYCAPGHFAWYRVPLALDEEVMVGPNFRIKPLLPLLTINTRFYLLALHQNGWRLFDCSRHTYAEVEAPTDLPSLAEPEEGDTAGKVLLLGSADSARREARRTYLRAVDRDLQAVLPSTSEPLVLAGVDDTVTAFRELTTHANVVDGAVLGNPDGRHPRELHEGAWELIEPHLKAQRQKATEHYQQLKGQGQTRASNDPLAIVPAAANGRVETLFVSRKQVVSGEFDPTSGSVAASDDGLDLLDVAAAQTLLNGGAVFASDEALPDEGPVAAVFRY